MLKYEYLYTKIMSVSMYDKFDRIPVLLIFKISFLSFSSCLCLDKNFNDLTISFV
jgi:hypothetical protein